MLPVLPTSLNPELRDVWKQFDGIVVITLVNEGRIENIDDMSKLVHLSGLSNCEIFYAKRHPKGGAMGCFDSHRQVAMIAKEKGWRNVVVFEDDFFPTYYLTPKALQDCVDFVKSDVEWDVLYMGGMPCGFVNPSRPVKGWDTILRCPTSMFQTHSYVMSKNMIDFMASIDHTVKIEYDKLTSIVRSYYYHNLLFAQQLADSTIETTTAMNYSKSASIMIHQSWYKFEQMGISMVTFLIFVIAFMFLYIIPMPPFVRLFMFSATLLTFILLAVFVRC